MALTKAFHASVAHTLGAAPSPPTRRASKSSGGPPRSSSVGPLARASGCYCLCAIRAFGALSPEKRSLNSAACSAPWCWTPRCSTRMSSPPWSSLRSCFRRWARQRTASSRRWSLATFHFQILSNDVGRGAPGLRRKCRELRLPKAPGQNAARLRRVAPHGDSKSPYLDACGVDDRRLSPYRTAHLVLESLRLGGMGFGAATRRCEDPRLQ
jgi:hypothetical protein